MRESLKKKMIKKGRRLAAGFLAVILAIFAAVPGEYPMAEVKAEEPVNSVEITGGWITHANYWVAKEGEDGGEKVEERDISLSEGNNIDTTLELSDEKVIKIVLQYEMKEGYFLESVWQNDLELSDNQYVKNEDGTITLEAGEKNSIGAIELHCIPQELQVENLTAVRGQNGEVPSNSVKLSWNVPVISEENGASLKDYRLIIQKKVGNDTTVIYNELYPQTEVQDQADQQKADNIPVCTYEDKGADADASFSNAVYTVSVVSDKFYQADSKEHFYGKGTSVEWKAVYDLQLCVNGDGKVKIEEKEYTSANTPCTVYNICSTGDIADFKVIITPGEGKGVSSLLINGSEEKQEIENNEYEMHMQQTGSMTVSFAPPAENPSVTMSGDKYTEIAENGVVEITSAKSVEQTYYGFKGLKEAENQSEWRKTSGEYANHFDGASQTVQIPAQELFGKENYAVLRAYSSKTGYADSGTAEQYYYRKPETPALENISFGNGYTAGQWTANDVTLIYKNQSERSYDGLQIGYILDGQGDMKWQDMNCKENAYSFCFTQTGEYTIALRFKMNDPNHPGGFVYGDTVLLTEHVMIDKTTPGLTVSGYNSGEWVTEDVTLKLQNQEIQLSGTTFQYAVSDMPLLAEALNWKDCENGNEVRLSCDKGKELVSYVYMKAVSNAGKESEVVSYVVNIDKEKPKAPDLSFSKVDGENGWYKTMPTITLKQSPEDGGSQVKTYYKIYLEGQNPDNIPEVLFDGTNQPSVSSDGKYGFMCYSRDNAGNVSEMEERQFKVDTGAPYAPSIEFKTENDSVLAHVINFITFGYFCNEKVTAVIQSSDSMSQIKEYHVWYIQDGRKDNATVIQEETAEIELPDGFKGTVCTYAVDYAGNTSKTSESDGIVYENTQAEITITADCNNNTWQKDNVKFHVIAQDEQSGLKNVEYILNGETVYQKDFTNDNYKDPVYMDQQEMQASEEAADSAGYILQVRVTDNAGNKSEKSEAVYIDKTAPVIEFSGIENGAYLKDTGVLTVKLKEQIYDLNKVTVSATRTIDGITTDYEMDVFVSNDVNSKKNYAFSEDGMYVVTVNAVDAAGNAAFTKQISFTVDKTAPKITISGPQNDSYYAADVPVRINVEESFYENNMVTINVKKTLDGQNSEIEFGNWSNQGRDSSLSRIFSEDGMYQIEVQAKDAAGNQAEMQQLNFIVDKTAPELSINGASDYLITGKAITLSYDVIESFFDTNQVSIQLQKEDAQGNVTELNVGNWNNSGKESSLTYKLEEEGIYTSVLTAVDKAGNQAMVRKTVTVDTSDPMIRHVDELDGKYYQVFQLPYELSEMVNDLTVPTVSMYLNSDEYDGVSKVTEEGKYVFRMDVSDEVGHEAVAQAEFIVDSTEPKVIFNGIQDGMETAESIQWSVSLADAKDMMKKVIVDGEEKKFNAETNTYQETMSGQGEHTIEVCAEDLAGNTTKEVIHVTIAQQPAIASWSRNHKPLIAGGIAVAAGAVGAGAVWAGGLGRKITGRRILKKKR